MMGLMDRQVKARTFRSVRNGCDRLLTDGTGRVVGVHAIDRIQMAGKRGSI